MNTAIDTPAPSRSDRQGLGLAQEIERLLIGGAWRWTGPEQTALRRLLQQGRRLHRDPAWKESLACLDLLGQGDNTCAAALVLSTLTALRNVRSAVVVVSKRPVRSRARRPTDVSAAPWREMKRPCRWETNEGKGPASR